MKLILIDGGPASGKNTLGALLVEKFQQVKNKVILLDLDTYVERINPTWIWKNKNNEKKDQQEARRNFAIAIRKYLQEDYTVIAIGERFLTRTDIATFLNRIELSCPVYLYHLLVPISLRRKRLHERGSHSLIDIDKDQKERETITLWPGHVYKNINSPEVDVATLLELIQDSKGLLI